MVASSRPERRASLIFMAGGLPDAASAPRATRGPRKRVRVGALVREVGKKLCPTRTRPQESGPSTVGAWAALVVQQATMSFHRKSLLLGQRLLKVPAPFGALSVP